MTAARRLHRVQWWRTALWNRHAYRWRDGKAQGFYCVYCGGKLAEAHPLDAKPGRCPSRVKS